MAVAKSKKLLDKINRPKDLKSFNVSELEQLAIEIRSLLIKTVAKNGGHLAPNLGTVDLTLAMHFVYNSPVDKLIWDVGHQAYTHKIVTGRKDSFSTIRKHGGISGYLKCSESEHDIFGAGHVGTAVSAALGFAEAGSIKKEKHEVVAVIGDGSMTNGLTFEGINNAGSLDTNITIVLNDNKFSISKNVGAIAKYLERLSSVHISGENKTDIESIFHALGYKYFGPIDGHNISQMIEVFKLAKTVSGPKLIHIITKKGNGYLHSENSPEAFHFTSPFVLESGKIKKDTKNLTYSKVFGRTLIKLAKKNKKIIAITAAMPAGTGLDKFAETFPERFYDVGIAEEHAIIFAAGLAKRGLRPVVAIYSSFLQRAYDQILHDLALQKIPVIIGVDRAGIVGADGPTHHGLFDISFLRNIPDLVIMSPKDENELQNMLYSATRYQKGPIIIRYPRGGGEGYKLNRRLQRIAIGKAEKVVEGSDLSILAVGPLLHKAVEAADRLRKKNISACVYNVRSIKPIDIKMIYEASKSKKILTVEENVLAGGFGSAVLELLNKLNINDVDIKCLGIEDKFVEHGEANFLREKYGLSAKNIEKQALALFKREK